MDIVLKEIKYISIKVADHPANTIKDFGMRTISNLVQFNHFMVNYILEKDDAK